MSQAILAAGLLAFLLPVSPVVPAQSAVPGNSPEHAVDRVVDRAVARAAALDEPVEVGELTTETFRVVAHPDGTFEAESSAEPVRVRKDGAWAPADTTLVRRTDGSIGPAAAALGIAFSGGGSGPLVWLADGPASIALSWTGPLPAPALSGDKALYANVLPDVDLVVQAGVEGFSSYLVVKNAAAAAHPALTRLSFPVTAAQATLAGSGDGGVAARDEQGRVLFDGPPARMWDSRQAPPEEQTLAAAAAEPPDSYEAVVPPMGARETAAPMAVSGQTLTVTPDPALLTGADTEYPVVIDPALSKAVKRKNWTMVWSNGYTFRNHPTEHARVGYDGWSGQNKKSRVFYQLDTSPFRGKHILKAVFRARQIHSPHWICTRQNAEPGVELGRTGTTSRSTTWSRQPTWYQTLSVNKMKKGHERLCGDPIDVEWDAEAAVEYAAARNMSVLTLGLRSANEGDKWGWRKYDNTASLPVLTVRYNSPPTRPVGLTFADPRKRCESLLAFPAPLAPRPTLQATLTDPDRYGSLKARFEVYRRSSPNNQHVWTGVPTAVVSPGRPIQITVGVSLSSNVPYLFRVRGEETQADAGYGNEAPDVSPWSAWCEFSVDTQPPPAPRVTSTDYPRSTDDEGTGAEYGGVGRSGLFTYTGAADVRSFRYRLNGGPWKTVNTGAGSVQLRVTPDVQGINLLRVTARDAAGFDSEDTHYLFKVAPGTAPSRVWRFDDGSGTVAADSNSWETKRPLTVVTGASGPAWSATIARAGGSLQLDGVDDYATVGDWAMPTPYSFTIATWIRLNTTEDNQAIAHQIKPDGRLGFLLYYSKAENRWGFQRANPDDPAQVATVFSARPPALNTWTHLVATYDEAENQLRLYVNGVLQGTVPYNHYLDATGVFEVGRWRYAGHTGVPLKAKLDQMHVYNRILTRDEIANLVQLPNSGGIPQPELVGHWRFDETSGTAAADSSGYGATATLEGGASLVTDPVRGRALKVDSSLAGRATAGTQIDGSGSFTVMAFVKPDSAARRGYVLTSGSAGTTPNGYESYGLGLSRNDPDRWVFTRRGMRGTAHEDVVATVSSAALEQEDYGEWVHLAAVYDSTTQTMFLYRDGVLQFQGGGDEGLAFAAAWHSGGPIVIGGEVNGAPPTSTFAGLIDDVRAYAGAMTEGQIRAACGSFCWWDGVAP
jgi:hypothetical protein